ncbi:MAG: LacI family DNA-binding transcriptional regulator [Anaerolineae bacterium]|nr:LacI family DNA-binding transcriptional regulator [Anaerolineae bacterium]
MGRATIRDVAQQAGVSKSTVSHVLNGTRFVEEETKQRVLQAIRELGYRPSTIARSLTTNRTQTIGVIVSDTSNHFFGEILRGIESVVRARNFSLLVCNTDETLELEEHYLNLLLAHQVDGIIAAATSRHWDAVEVAELKHLPMVFVDRTFEEMGGRPYIGADNRGGAYLGARHLIGCGHREIGILAGFQRLSTMRERLAGFQQALADCGIPLPDEWIATSALSADSACQAAVRILSLPYRPTALFVSNNFLSLGTLLALKQLGLRCPDDVSLVCFDDHPWAAVANPPLTVIRQPVYELGQQAAQTMLALLNGEELAQTTTTMPCELIVRQSCCIAEHS